MVATTDKKPTTRKKTPTASSPPSEETIEILALNIAHVNMTLRGTAPLIQHKWSEKAKEMMLNAQMRKTSTGREAKNPDQDFLDGIYLMPGGKYPTISGPCPGQAYSVFHEDGGPYGFPSIGFKNAFVRAGTYMNEKMTFLRGVFHVRNELTLITGHPQPRQDMVRLAMNKADIRFRPEWTEWEAHLEIELNLSAISIEKLFNIANMAGFSVGIGEWRPERNGSNGTFAVVNE